MVISKTSLLKDWCLKYDLLKILHEPLWDSLNQSCCIDVIKPELPHVNEVGLPVQLKEVVQASVKSCVYSGGIKIC